MNLAWFYFTVNEVLVQVTEQETMEFPIIASKLWGEFSPTFLGMGLAMLIAICLMTGLTQIGVIA